MKKRVNTYLIVLTVIFVLGLALDIGGEYGHERVLWQIQNDFQKMVNQPQSIPEGAISDIIGRYEKFIRRYPKSSLAPQALLSMGNIYTFLNDYPKAREIFEQIIKNYSYNADVVARAQFALGKSYEDEGNWDQANALYKTIIRDYPLTSTGFSLPLYVAQYYASRGSNTLAHDALGEAVEFYQNIVANNPNGPLQYAALRMLLGCRLNQGQWHDALDTAKRLMFQYPSAPRLLETAVTIRNISLRNLNDTGYVVSTYQEFMRKNPGHPINATFKKMIVRINNPKLRNTLDQPDQDNEK